MAYLYSLGATNRAGRITRVVKVLVYGAGAVGCLIGGYLALSGNSVVLLGRDSLAKAVSASGLTLRLKSGIRVVRDVAVASTLAEALRIDERFDWIAFTMKAYDTVPAILELQEHLAQVPPVVSFQNGVGNEESLRDALGPDKVVGGTLTTAVSMAEPGTVIEERRRGIALAADSPAYPIVAAGLAATELKLSIVRTCDSLKWSKLLLNILGNATSAILDLVPGIAFQDWRVFDIEMRALREALSIMKLKDIPVVNLPGVPAGWLARLVSWLPPVIVWPILLRQVGAGRGDKLPSLMAAIRAGSKRTEAAWLNGAVAHAAKGLERLAPVNHTLALLLSDICTGRIPADMYRHNIDLLATTIDAATGK